MTDHNPLLSGHMQIPDNGKVDYPAEAVCHQFDTYKPGVIIRPKHRIRDFREKNEEWWQFYAPPNLISTIWY